MKIKVIAPFEIKGRDKDDCLELPEGSRVRDVAMKSPVGLIIPVFVNGEQAKISQMLKDGDVVVFVGPMRGG